MLRSLLFTSCACGVVLSLSPAGADEFRPGELEQTAYAGQGWGGYPPYGYAPYGTAPSSSCPTCATQPGVYPAAGYGQYPQYPTQQYPQYLAQPAYTNGANGWCGTPTGVAPYRYPSAGYGSYPVRTPSRGGLFGLGLLGGW